MSVGKIMKSQADFCVWNNPIFQMNCLYFRDEVFSKVYTGWWSMDFKGTVSLNILFKQRTKDLKLCLAL